MNIKAVSTNKSTGLRKTDQLYPLIYSIMYHLQNLLDARVHALGWMCWDQGCI